MMVRILCIVVAISTALAIGAFTQQDERDGEEEEDDEGMVVETPSGFVRGTQFDNVLNGSFFAFLGIPYARPPLGTLRFMAPEPIEPWEGVFDATQEGPLCMQFEVSKQSASGSEDCLMVDIFTPHDPHTLKKNPLPVLVFIHGGAFHFGGTSMEELGPDFLMTKELILIQIRYRLSIFGFLSLQDDLVPGNAGMKDQVLALKWVHNNIGAFGGDPKKVTIFGQSSGASSVQMHMLSPLSKGLFHQAIMSSGAAISSGQISRTPLLTASIMADMYNCSKDGNEAVVACLQAVPAEELTQTQYNALPVERFAFDADTCFFTPCIEPKHDHAFLTEDPFDLMSRGDFLDVPLVIGITKRELGVIESVLSLGLIPEKFRRKLLQQMAGNLARPIPKNKPFMGSKKMGEAVKDFYFKGKSPSLHNLPALVNFFSDVRFLMPNVDSVTLHLRHKKSHVFVYEFTHDTDYSFSRRTLFFAPPNGVNHGDFVLGYIFFALANDPDPEHEAFPTIQRAVQMWANFVTYGNPTPDDSLGLQWLPSEQANRYYLNFGAELRLEKNIEGDRVTFWNKVRKMENFTV